MFNRHKLRTFWLILFCAVLLLCCKSNSPASTVTTVETLLPEIEVTGEGFEIYLLKDDVSPSEILSIDDVVISDEPLVSFDDVIYYDALTHEILLTDEAFTRIVQLHVSVFGKSFVVCIDEVPQYYGAFWVPYSSVSYDGIIIDKPLSQEGPKTIRIKKGYPHEGFSQSRDPRNNIKIFEVLENAGKLINKP